MGSFNLVIGAQAEPLYDECITSACETDRDCGRKVFNIRNDEYDDNSDFIASRIRRD